MSQLIFPITADGLMVNVRVNVDIATISSLTATGQPVPNSIEAKGLIDTGTDVSAVAPSIIRQLGIQSSAQRKTHGIGGNVQVRIFKVGLYLFSSTQPHLPWLVQPTLQVIELPQSLPVEVLIGMDVIRACNLHVDGPGGRFTLDF
jgi:hypothetical protein